MRGYDTANIAISLLEVLAKFKIEGELGVFVMDKASNNFTVMRALQRSIPSPWKTLYEGLDAALEMDPEV